MRRARDRQMDVSSWYSPCDLLLGAALGERVFRSSCDLPRPDYDYGAQSDLRRSAQIQPRARVVGRELTMHRAFVAACSIVLLVGCKSRSPAASVADPTEPMAWGHLSDALLELGDLERAERAAQTMMDLKPDLPAYSRASYFQWLGGDVRAAVESARLAIDAGGDRENAEPRAWSLVQAAMLFWHVGDYDGADAGFEQALAVVRDYPPALVGRGRVAMAHGDASRAADFFRRAHERSPLVETAWLLGDALETEGDAQGAQASFARAERDGKRSDRRTLSLLYSTRDEKPSDALRLGEEERTTRGEPYTD